VRNRRASGPASLCGAQLGQLAVAFGLDSIVGLALGDDLGLVGGQLPGR
jgi:hypothetical protein